MEPKCKEWWWGAIKAERVMPVGTSGHMYVSALEEGIIHLWIGGLVGEEGCLERRCGKGRKEEGI